MPINTKSGPPVLCTVRSRVKIPVRLESFVVLSQLTTVIGLSEMLERCAYRKRKCLSWEAEAGAWGAVA